MKLNSPGLPWIEMLWMGVEKMEASCVICPLYSYQRPPHASLDPPAPLDPPASQELRRASAHHLHLLAVGFSQPGMSFPGQAGGSFSLPTSEVPLSFQMKHFHTGQVVFIEFSSMLSSVVRRDILINYSPRGLKDQ